jgi:CheY-like chemotaxis protein
MGAVKTDTAQKKTFLIVEDDDDLRKLFVLALRLAGFETREARGGFEAIRKLDSGPTDLVVLDLLLPGIDGFEVRREIAANPATRDIPVVIVTGMESDLSYLEPACVLRKPIEADDLVRAVRRCLQA